MQNKPNILIIQTDQQSSWTLSCYGGELVETPFIDSIAEQGALFKNFFTPSAVCTPSRGCFITGRYPHVHGAYRNGEALNKDELTFAHLFKEQGYETGYAGKWHLGGGLGKPGWLERENSMGFDDCRYMFDNGHMKEAIEQPNGKPLLSSHIGNKKTYMTDWLANHTIEFIQRSRNHPFLFMVSIPDPHQPFNVRPPYDTMYNPQEMLIPESFYEEQLPDWAELDEWGRKMHYPMDMPNREVELRRVMAQYCGQVKCIDDNVGKIINSLKQLEIYDDTIIIFTSDHGEYMGEHGLQGKNNLYETAYRVPLVIRWPREIPAGIHIDPFVTTVDFQQTIAGLLGIQPSGREQGRDASGFLKGENLPWTNDVFIHPSDVPRTGIITEQFELVYVGEGWNKEEGDEFEDHILFDRAHDPSQMNNLFKDPGYQQVIKELTDRIIQHHKEIGTDPKVLPMIVLNQMVT